MRRRMLVQLSILGLLLALRLGSPWLRAREALNIMAARTADGEAARKIVRVRQHRVRSAVPPASMSITASTAATKKTSASHELVAHLLRPTSWPPSRLDTCVELMKPDSLSIRSMGTPKNHRSPPA